MFRRPRATEFALDWADVSAIVRALMEIDAKLERILRILEEDDGEEEEEPDA